MRSPARRTGSTSASRSASRAEQVPFVERVHRARVRASRTCCSPTAPTSRWTSRELRQLRAADRGGPRADRSPTTGQPRISRFQAGLCDELAALGVVTRAGAGVAAAGRRRCASCRRSWSPSARRTPARGAARPTRPTGFSLAGDPVRPWARRDPRRRHGPRQDRCRRSR